ncbi:MAG: hypothetical protein JOY58_19725, partial [Solirubrobacterales bacterium]|nr:hypothetical protein [Solirubrobacterales bacterium]
MSVPFSRALTAAVVAIATLTACGGSSGGTQVRSSGAAPAGRVTQLQSSTQSPAPGRQRPTAELGSAGPAHVAVILMENEEYGGVIGSPAAPFINGLARRYGLAEAMYAVTHPSLPNYLALTGGSAFGIGSDCTSCAVHGSSIVNQLESAHISWKAYMEDLPRPCFTGASAGDYAKKHDPFAYYTQITNNRAWCSRIVPLDSFFADERSDSLPRFIWITPNLCHDMHDCSVA